jgi:hypothetical protein
MFDSASGSSKYNLLRICRSVTCSDLPVKPFQGATRRPGGHRANQLQRLLIHFVLAKMAGQSTYSRFHACRIGRQTMEESYLMFDAHNNQGWLPIPEESVYVAINLTIEMCKVVFGVIAIMHWLCAKGGLGCIGNEASGFRARVLRKSGGLAELIRAFEDACIIQFQSQNVELEVPAGKRQ